MEMQESEGLCVDQEREVQCSMKSARIEVSRSAVDIALQGSRSDE